MLVEDQKIVIAYVLLLNAQLMCFSLSYLCHIRENVEFLTRPDAHRVRQTKKNALE